ncbi:MAG: orotate phosphoribosyltransferase [Cytophagaceae bacterium]|jgi:orotate phosphoribosyltransferase|nr:orotate phosphoribosyltransferase [Cytophagaceae bacterium]
MSSKIITAETAVAKKVASLLLEVEAVKLSPQKPFRWASGWNSPIYCDNRYTLSFPAVRAQIRDGLIELVRKHFPAAEALAGVATAGVPQGAIMADHMNLPFLYVRPKPKDHGMENLIEGKVSKGQRVVLVEDLISTGGSSIKAAEALRQSGIIVEGMVAIFTYGFPVAEENFAKADVTLATLSNYSLLVEEALSQNYVAQEQMEILNAWRTAPEKF